MPRYRPQWSLLRLAFWMLLLGIWLTLVRHETSRILGLATLGSALSALVVWITCRVAPYRRDVGKVGTDAASQAAAKGRRANRRRLGSRRFSHFWLSWRNQSSLLTAAFVALLWLAVENELIDQASGPAAWAPPLIALAGWVDALGWKH